MSAHPGAPEKSRFAGMPRLTVRDRESPGQMLMFTVVSVTTIAVMMLLPSPRAAFGAVERVQVATTDAASGKAARLPVPTEVDRACAGQTWGAEKLDCILAIAREGGIERPIRLAAASLRP